MSEIPGVLSGSLLVLCLVAGVHADEIPSNDKDQTSSESASDDDADPGLLQNVGNLVVDARNTATDRLDSFIYGIDSFFASGSSVGDPNQSYARLRIDALQPADDDFKFKSTIKLRVVLPRSEKRFRLLLSSEDDETPASGADRNEQVSGDDDQNVALALRFIRSAREDSKVNFDLGARMRDDSPQLFVRIDTRYDRPLSSHWTTRIGNDLYYYSKSGYENDLQFNFRRRLDSRDRVFFRTSTGFNWQEGSKGASIGETLGIYASIGDDMALALEALASYNTALNDGASERFPGYGARLRFRHNVWKPWFYYEIWPTVDWPASNGYEKTYGGLLRVEIEIGDR